MARRVEARRHMDDARARSFRVELGRLELGGRPALRCPTRPARLANEVGANQAPEALRLLRPVPRAPDQSGGRGKFSVEQLVITGEEEPLWPGLAAD